MINSQLMSSPAGFRFCDDSTTECFIDLGNLNLFKISLPWSKSVKLTVDRGRDMKKRKKCKSNQFSGFQIFSKFCSKSFIFIFVIYRHHIYLQNIIFANQYSTNEICIAFCYVVISNNFLCNRENKMPFSRRLSIDLNVVGFNYTV